MIPIKAEIKIKAKTNLKGTFSVIFTDYEGFFLLGVDNVLKVEWHHSRDILDQGIIGYILTLTTLSGKKWPFYLKSTPIANNKRNRTIKTIKVEWLF